MLRMRIKGGHILFGINILTVVLILIISLLLNNVLRVIIGLPLILFSPGYTLISAIFYRKSNLDNKQRITLSFAISIAIVPLIGLVLNATPWGITLYPILISLAIFIIVTSIIAWLRQWNLPDEEKPSFNINITKCNKGSALSKTIALILIIFIIGITGVLVYTIATHKTVENFTEFYILGLRDRATDYPRELKLGDSGKVVLGIINHEQKVTSYIVEIKIDGIVNGTLGPITMDLDEKFENEVSFIAQKVGDNQKLEFILYKDGQNEPYLNLFLWIDVK
jgi:uncharacterized membrane protein